MLRLKNIDGSAIDDPHKFAPNNQSGIANRKNNDKITKNGIGTCNSQNTMKQLIVLTMLLFTFKEATGLAGE